MERRQVQVNIRTDEVPEFCHNNMGRETGTGFGKEGHYLDCRVNHVKEQKKEEIVNSNPGFQAVYAEIWLQQGH